MRTIRRGRDLANWAACLILSVTGSTTASAQEVGMRPGGPAAQTTLPIASPVVANGRITFNLRAPDAKVVSLRFSGPLGNLELPWVL